MANIFNRVWVLEGPNRTRLVEWRLTGLSALENPVFYIEVAYGGGEFLRLNPTTPVTNVCYYELDVTLGSGTRPPDWYRVVMVDGLTTYTSQPAQVGTGIPRQRWIQIKEIMRLEYVRMRVGPGIPGYLLIRKEQGTKCTECLDDDTGGVIDSNCEACRGTGIIGGYYAPYYPYYISVDKPIAKEKTVMEPFATVDPKTLTVRCLAYPTVEPDSIWVDGYTGRRWIFQQLQVAADMLGVPLIYSAALNCIPATWAENTIPVSEIVNTENWRTQGAGITG